MWKLIPSFLHDWMSCFREEIWKTFPRQDEAMEFAKQHVNARVFSYQDHVNGVRRFLVSKYKEFWQRQVFGYLFYLFKPLFDFGVERWRKCKEKWHPLFSFLEQCRTWNYSVKFLLILLRMKMPIVFFINYPFLIEFYIQTDLFVQLCLYWKRNGLCLLHLNCVISCLFRSL